MECGRGRDFSQTKVKANSLHKKEVSSRLRWVGKTKAPQSASKISVIGLCHRVPSSEGSPLANWTPDYVGEKEGLGGGEKQERPF